MREASARDLMAPNLIMNVAAIAISIPVPVAIAPYLGVAPAVVLFASLATAGMPCLVLVGAPPDAIAYQSRMFLAFEFFRAGLMPSVGLVVVVALFVWNVWPWMGIPNTL